MSRPEAESNSMEWLTRTAVDARPAIILAVLLESAVRPIKSSYQLLRSKALEPGESGVASPIPSALSSFCHASTLHIHQPRCVVATGTASTSECGSPSCRDASHHPVARRAESPIFEVRRSSSTSRGRKRAAPHGDRQDELMRAGLASYAHRQRNRCRRNHCPTSVCVGSLHLLAETVTSCSCASTSHR